MRKAFRILSWFFIAMMIVACGDLAKNKYESVPGDPLKARIYTLDNGLKVYLTVNPEQPRVQTCIAVRVGGKNDPAETTGLAHYFEHLMFKGTKNFGTQNYVKEEPMLDEIEALFESYRKTTDDTERKALYRKIDSVSYEASKLAIPNEYDKLMAAIGSEGNAYTGTDMTVYVEDIPSNELDNWAKIQADRFQNAVIRGFHTELEAVYEEKNMSLTNDWRKVYEQLMASLFPTHPYGTQTVLGTQEHLKNPSIKSIKDYYKTWYVPNNMAICMSGDIHPDSVMKVIEKYFGGMQPNQELPRLQFKPEAPLTSPVVKEIWGLETASIAMGWRFSGASAPETEMLLSLSQVLYNGTAGLMDLDINQQQRLLSANAYPMLMADYSMFAVFAVPKEGQSLEEAKEILLAEVEKLKKGDFDESLLEAALNNYKRRLLVQLEDNEERADMFVQAFVNGISWKDQVNFIERLSNITKQQIVDFANEHLRNDNYVVVYKRQGKDPNEKKITKPDITPIFVNRDTSSAFLREIQKNKVKPIEPVFVDYGKDMEQKTAKAGIPVLYKHNNTNDLFYLTYLFDMGTNEDKMLKTAVQYLDYLGTSKMTSEQIKREFYRLACDFKVYPSFERTYIQLEGLEENRAEAMALFELLLADAQPNAEVLENMKVDIRKGRMDAKLNQKMNFARLTQYGIYGSHSPGKNVLSTGELDSLQPKDLLKRIHELNSHEHRILYYGPAPLKQVVADVNGLHRTPEALTPVVKNDTFKILKTEQNRVLIAPYDARQIYMASISVLGEKFDPALNPVMSAYNEYFGSSMNSIVFQEMREARGLAYSAQAGIQRPPKLDRPYLFSSFIATQNDKLIEALATFDDIINNMPESESAFLLAKESLLTRLRSQRITKLDVLWNYIEAQDLGVNEDLNRALFQELQHLTLADVKAFQEKWVKGRKSTYCILGDEKDLDMKKLSSYGSVTRVTTEDIFGY